MLSWGLSIVGAAIARVPYLFPCSSHLTPRHQSEEATCRAISGRHYGEVPRLGEASTAVLALTPPDDFLE